MGGVVITPLTKVKEIKGDTVVVFNVFTKAEREQRNRYGCYRLKWQG
jgi:hypothetical protein